MNYQWKMFCSAILVCLIAACTAENPGSNQSEDTGLSPDSAMDASDGAGPTDTGEQDTGPSDADPGDADPGDADTGSSDAAGDGGPNYGRTIADYRRCVSDSECPVGLGSCVKEVTLNRPDANGVDSVLITEIFEDLEDGQGICTEVCTESGEACSPLSVNGTTPDPVEHTCQIVVLGEAPYPASAPSFPFDDQLDPDEQEKGQPFGAICRPPFELDDDVNSSFCSQCQSDDDCAESDSLCWSRFANAPVAAGDSGICLSGCTDESDCPLGFSCDAQDDDGQSYCRPTLDTCTDCQDIDGDGFGAGRCGSEDNPITAHDCDDRNADAYFDPDNMDHPFPATCGEQDFNCNGQSDQVEQVGPDAYPVEHCATCFDTCDGALDNGQYACQTDGDDSDAPAACAVKCDVDADGNPTHADCDGDPTNGCEVAIDDPSRLYYPDADGDGYGDPDGVYFACDPDDVPAGYVSNGDDCNDSSDQVYGGNHPAAEICDGLDNDCDGTVDNNLGWPQDLSCSTGEPGVCDAGLWECHGSAGPVCVGNILPGDETEVCDGVDNDCDGDVDEPSAQDAQTFYMDGDGDGYGDPSNTSVACEAPEDHVTDNTDCNDNNASQNPGQDELCSTSFDDDCDGQINEDTAVDAPTWYEDFDGDGYGDPDSSQTACTKPDAYNDADGNLIEFVANDDDCDDNNADINPDADEMCNDGVDNDCDGQVNESSAVDASTYYRDRDGDNYGDPNNSTLACSVPTGYTLDDTDCNDDPNNRGSSANPGEVEVCDGMDNDCDGAVDEGCPKYYTVRTGNVATKLTMGTQQPNHKTSVCGANRVWTGASVAYYSSSWPVQEIDVLCRDIVIDENTNSTPYTYSVNSANSETVDGAGFQDDDSDRNDFQCGDGEAIYKVEVNYDSLIREVTFHCRKYELNGSGTSATLQSGASATTVVAFGTKGGTDHSAECGNNQVAIGAKMYNGFYGVTNTLYGIELRCQTLELDKK